MVKNAVANVVRGGANAMVALALPHFLTRVMATDRFAAWALMLQMAAYANYLDFGLQTAVARFLAQAVERKDDRKRDELLSTAVAMMAAAGGLAFCLLACVALLLPHVLKQVPTELHGEIALGLLVMAAGSSLLLPMSAFTGVLVGLQRNELSAIAIGVSRVAGAVAVLVAVHFTQSLVLMAVCVSGFNLAGGVAQYVMAKRLIPGMLLKMGYVTRRTMQELARYCSGLTVFSFSMLLISGLDVTIVGYFSFSSAGYYAVASTLVAFAAGLSGSVFAAMMTPIAVLQARGSLERIRDLVVRTTQWSSYASLGLTLAVFVFGAAALRLWVGPVYAARALPILEVLLIAQSIRLFGNSYSTMLIATGQQRWGILSAAIEACVNLGLSLLGAVWLGPIGVAWGTMAGSVAGVTSMLLITMRRATDVPIQARKMFLAGLVRPLLVLVPLILTVMVSRQRAVAVRGGMFVVATFVSSALAWVFGDLRPEARHSADEE